MWNVFLVKGFFFVSVALLLILGAQTVENGERLLLDCLKSLSYHLQFPGGEEGLVPPSKSNLEN